MTTIRDVAKASGVSIATVSYILNNSPRPYSETTRLRVREAARQLNYQPSAAARRLVRPRIQTLGVLFGWCEPAIVTNDYAAGVLCGIFMEATGRGYDIHLFTTPWVNATISARRFLDQRTDGVLIVGPFLDSDMASGLNALNVPCVVVSAPTAVTGVPYVDVDNRAGARLAVEHLLALGHRRIAFLAGDLNHDSTLERMESFRQTLANAGVPLPEEYVVHGSFDTPVIRKNAEGLLALPEPPTAIFATNDGIAITLIDVARERGWTAPGDLSVVGFDDYPMSSLVTPPLTTVRQPLADIGQRATRLLLDRIDGREIEQQAHIYPPELIVRGSTAPPRR